MGITPGLFLQIMPVERYLLLQYSRMVKRLQANPEASANLDGCGSVRG
jgi:hypothetical protein